MAGHFNKCAANYFLAAQQALPGAQQLLCLVQQSFAFFVVWPVANATLVAINKIATAADIVFFMFLLLMVINLLKYFIPPARRFACNQ